MSLSKQLYLIIAIIFFIIFSGNFLISVKNMKEYLEVESATKAQDTATSIGMSLRPLIKDKNDPEIESIIKVISNSGFYNEIRLEDADFTIKSSELIGAAKQLDDSNWEIESVSVDPKFGSVEKVGDDSSLNEQLLKLEGETEDLGFVEDVKSKEYRFIPSNAYKQGGEIIFNIKAKKPNDRIITTAKLNIKKVLIEEKRDIKFEYVPNWFINLIPINLEEKRSEISDGWNTSAVIYVSPNPGEAYAKLFEQAKNSIVYAFIAFIISMIFLLVFVQFLLRPLKKIEALAKNIAQAKFGVIDPLPWTIEIKNVSIAMNDMSRKIESMISKLTNNINVLSKKLSEDDLTGLDLKQTLETDLKQMFIKKEDGFIFNIKIDNLAAYAKTHTKEEVDSYLIRFSNILKNLRSDNSLNINAYRVFGSEFALLAKTCDKDCALGICARLKLAFNALGDELTLTEVAHIGAAPFNELASIDELLQGANEAYEKAKIIGPNEFFIGAKNEHSRDMNLWRELIKQIITDSDFDVDFINDAYKVEDDSNEIVMQEAFTKAKDKENNQIPIGTFVSIAEKYEMIESFDKAVIEKVITYMILNNINHKICINLSIDSIGKKDFVKWLQNRISRNKELASQLVFSLTAYSVAKDMDIFKNFCDSIHDCGAKVIIKRFESKFIPTENLKEFNVDYIRLARDYTTDIEEERSKQEFLDSICDLANLLNIQIFAENIKSEKDLAILKKVKLFASSKCKS